MKLTEGPDEPGPPASEESLWPLIAGPTIWALHFLASYLTAALWCAKVAGRNGALGPLRWVLAAYTLAALIGLGVSARDALRRHRYGRAPLPHDYDTAADRHRFLGFATLLLSGLSAVAVLFVAAAAFFIGTCR